MAIAQRGTATRSAYITSGSVDFARPTGLAAGDFVLLDFMLGATGITITPPAGFAQRGPTLAFSGSGSDNYRGYQYYKIADGTEPATLSFGLSTSTDHTGGIIAYSGVDTMNPFDTGVTYATGPSASIDAPSLTTATAGAVLNFMALHWNGVNGNETPTNGWTMQLLETGRDNIIQDRTYSTPGATGTVSVTTSSTPWTVWMNALRPASTSTGLGVAAQCIAPNGTLIDVRVSYWNGFTTVPLGSFDGLGMQRVTRSGTALQVGGVTKRFSGTNMYWLGLDDNQGGSPGTFPTQTQITNALQGAVEMGVNLVRAHTVGISAGTSMSFQTGTNTFNAANLDSADWAVYQARQKGIYLMVPLTDEWNYYHGGKWNFVHWAYQDNPSGLTDVNGQTKDDYNERQFFNNDAPGLRIRAKFKTYIYNLLNHVNPYTGTALKDETAILAFETINEGYPATPEWTQDIAAYIKSIAPNALVADGSAATGLAVGNQPGLNASAIDILGSHYYVDNGSSGYQGFTGTPTQYGANTTAIQRLASDVQSAVNAGKAFIIGEYPWTKGDMAAWYSAIENNANISGDMYWSQIASGVGHGDSSVGGPDYALHRPYANTNEQSYGPPLARHISAITGIPTTNGAGTDPVVVAPTNLISSTAIKRASAAGTAFDGNTTTTSDSTRSEEGGTSMRFAPQTNGSYLYAYGVNPSDWAPVTPGTQYTGYVDLNPQTTNGGTSWRFHVKLVWFNSSNSYLSASPIGGTVSCPSGSWTRAFATATAPTNAAWCVVQIEADDAQNTTDYLNGDQFGVNTGTAAGPWSYQ